MQERCKLQGGAPCWLSWSAEAYHSVVGDPGGMFCCTVRRNGFLHSRIIGVVESTGAFRGSKGGIGRWFSGEMKNIQKRVFVQCSFDYEKGCVEKSKVGGPTVNYLSENIFYLQLSV